MPERGLVLLTGPVGAGKSTVALAVATRLRTGGCPAAVIDLDLVYCMARQRDGFADEGTWRTARRGAASLANVFFDDGARVVVVEGGFFSDEECDEVCDHMTSSTALELVALDVSFEEALRRAQADPHPGRVVSRDPEFLRALHGQFTDALPFLRVRGLVVDADRSSPDEVAVSIGESIRGALG